MYEMLEGNHCFDSMVVPGDFDKSSFDSEVGTWLKKVKGSTGDQDAEVVIVDSFIKQR